MGVYRNFSSSLNSTLKVRGEYIAPRLDQMGCKDYTGWFKHPWLVYVISLSFQKLTRFQQNRDTQGHPNLVNQNLQRWTPNICSNKLPGDSGTYGSWEHGIKHILFQYRSDLSQGNLRLKEPVTARSAGQRFGPAIRRNPQALWRKGR